MSEPLAASHSPVRSRKRLFRRNAAMNARCLIILLLLPPLTHAEEKSPKDDLARTIHSLIVPQVAKQYEDRSGWGQTIPMPANLRRPGLRRTTIKVGDRM